MKTKVILPVVLQFVVATSFAQGLTPPSEGKAVIYFTRVTAMGAIINFEFFHGNHYFGVFDGRNYLRYECEPGKHLFWASSENKEFMTAELNAGGIYIVLVDVEMGIGKARVGLTPITAKDKAFERAKALIDKKAPIQMTPEKIDQMNAKLATFIVEKLEKYETVWKNEKDFKHLSPEMAIPAASL
jgi:hypothetical protein